MAELILSAFLHVLFDRLSSPELLKFARREGLGKQLDKWGETMERIREVLDDAEEKQQTKKTVKAWLDDLRDLAYEVEDILDEFATEALQRKLMAVESQASASMIVQKTDASCCNFRLLSKKWIDPKLRPTFVEIMAALKPLQKANNQFSSPRPSTSTGSGRPKALPSQTAEEAG
ncbi:putative disease resistance RPP13-like protein 1 [Juglans microcarpa x Juglans regia]|uniref:putative disease resistance RPP13-like protein 1 n=1 Tax=Juglans microcarpa x Juglans regia TaxID=2249226 RepID=UPI001B7EB687|nr:putative disease resistance RPP13-like protein 1 [Juglans microcarpa x Juglans regia]